MSTGVDTQVNTWEPVRGRGALEVRDLCLFEDGSERRGALASDVVVVETAGEGRSGNGERAAVSTGADGKANTRRGVPKVGDLHLL